MARGTAPESSSHLASSFTLPAGYRKPWERGPGAAGLGKGKGITAPPKRFRKILRDNLKGVTRGDIRRLARRGGVKRISAQIYETTREVLKARLEVLMKDLSAIAHHKARKTITVEDVIFVLRRLGTPIVGFGDTHVERLQPMKRKERATRVPNDD